MLLRSFPFPPPTITLIHTQAPAEHVHFFTEQYLMLPPTYQVSFQDKFRGVHDEAKVHGDAYVQHLRRFYALLILYGCIL